MPGYMLNVLMQRARATDCAEFIRRHHAEVHSLMMAGVYFLSAYVVTYYLVATLPTVGMATGVVIVFTAMTRTPQFDKFRAKLYPSKTKPANKSSGSGKNSREDAPLLNAAMQAEVMRCLPPWINSPDVFKVEGLNKLADNLWPSLRESIEGIVQPMVLGMLKKAMGESAISGLEIYLGANPPLIVGVKHYSQIARGKDVMLDLMIQSDGDTSGYVTFNVLSITTLTVAISDLFFKGCIRLEFGPLCPTLPPFSGISVSMPYEPAVDFELTFGGIPLTALPGVTTALRYGLSQALNPTFLSPCKLKVPFWKTMEADPMNMSALGMLRVRIKKAVDLPNVDYLSLTNPYCVFTVEDGEDASTQPERHETRVIDDDLDPLWDESFEVLVRNDGAKLRFTLWHFEQLYNHTVIGEVPGIDIVQQLKPDMLTDASFELNSPNGSAQSQGVLKCGLEWKPLLERQAVHLQRDMDHRDSEWSKGVLLLHVIRCQNVTAPAPTSILVTADVGGEPKRTASKQLHNAVFFDSFLYFPVSHVNQQKLRLRLVEDVQGAVLGTLEFRISDVVNSGGFLNGEWKLAQSRNGSIELSLEFRYVSPERKGADQLSIIQHPEQSRK